MRGMKMQVSGVVFSTVAFLIGAAVLVNSARGATEPAEPLPTDPTLEQVLQAHYAAIGGLQAWQAVETMKVETRISVGPIEGRRIEYRARPASYRRDHIGPMGTTTLLSHDGTATSYMAGMPGPRPVPAGLAAEAASRTRIGGTLVAAATEPIDLQLRGTERFRGATYFVVAYSPEPGLTVEYLIERYDHLVEWVRASREDGPPGVTRLRDHRNVDGLLVPFRIEPDRGSAARVEKVELNPPFPDDLFLAR